MTIEVDDRERKIIEYVKKNCTYNNYVVKRLLVGDFIVNSQVIIERKTLKDLSASIIDKRIYKQIHKLKCQPKPFYFIIEGDVDEYIKLQKNKKYHLLPITSLKTRLKHMKMEDIMLYYSNDLVDTINIIEILYNFYTKFIYN